MLLYLPDVKDPDQVEEAIALLGHAAILSRNGAIMRSSGQYFSAVIVLRFEADVDKAIRLLNEAGIRTTG